MLMLNQGGIIILTALLIEHLQKQEYLFNSLMRHEKMETVSHFAAAVSHELRNPLQSVKGFVQLLQEYEYPRAKQLEFQQTILEELKAAEDLIDDYLIYAKPLYGEMKRIEVEPELSHVIKIMTPYANARNVEFFVQGTDGASSILGDSQKLHQALVNIIRNGIEAMPDGGKLQVELETSAHTVCVHIQDEGMGMTKQQLKRLGEPYFSNKSKGTGLGLMVTYSILNQMGGEITVESEVSKGTKFTLEFPKLPNE